MRRRCIGGPRGQKTRQKTRIWLLRVQLSVERRRGRNQASMSSMRTGRIDAAGRRASILGLFKQPKSAVHSCRCACPALRCEQLAGRALGHGCDCIRRAHSRQPSRDPAPRAEAPPGPEAFRRRPDSPARSRRDSTNAPGPAPLRRGRPPRRPEEVDPRDHTSDGAGAGGAKAADGGAEGPEGAREA